MAIPDRDDWINQAIAEVADVLKKSSKFMAVIKKVEENLPDLTMIRKDHLPHAGVVYIGHDRASDDDSSGQTDYTIDVGIQITGRGADRVALWKTLQKAAAAITTIVSIEIGPSGSQFNGYSGLAFPLGGKPVEEQEERMYTAIIYTGIKLHVTLVD